jgi:hypothetical protein
LTPHPAERTHRVTTAHSACVGENPERRGARRIVLYVRFVSKNEAKAKQDQWKEFFT